MSKEFISSRNPVISVDAKKKENIGNFKNNGSTWQRMAIPVNDHDFPSDAKGKAIPYGIYDIQQNTKIIIHHNNIQHFYTHFIQK